MVTKVLHVATTVRRLYNSRGRPSHWALPCLLVIINLCIPAVVYSELNVVVVVVVAIVVASFLIFLLFSLDVNPLGICRLLYRSVYSPSRINSIAAKTRRDVQRG